MSKLSLTNSVDIVCNSLKIIKDNDLIDIFSLFLLKSDARDIVGFAPDLLNSLQEIAAAIGDDNNLFKTINDKLALKSDAESVYTKSFINALMTSYFTREQMTLLLNLKLDTTAIASYYTRSILTACSRTLTEKSR